MTKTKRARGKVGEKGGSEKKTNRCEKTKNKRGNRGQSLPHRKSRVKLKAEKPRVGTYIVGGQGGEQFFFRRLGKKKNLIGGKTDPEERLGR